MSHLCECGESGRPLVRARGPIETSREPTARQNGERFVQHGVFAINFNGSPGAGKTALLEATARLIRQTRRFAVLGKDLSGRSEAQRLAVLGVRCVSLLTGSACQLDSRMVESALGDLPLDGLDYVFIENVGSLACPAVPDLGQAVNVVALAATEGEDKPLRYPAIFQDADLVLLTKIDLLPHLEFSLEAIENALARVMPRPSLLPVSARTGSGLALWTEWLEQQAHQFMLGRERGLRIED